MATLLYVTCDVRPQEQSCVLMLGNEFLEEYLRMNAHDEVQILDLYRDSIQRVDFDVLNCLERIERGENYVPVSNEERNKMSRIWRLADQFSRCDKYVFVTHSLNLWFPAEFKMYIDAICVPNRTYRLSPYGVEGLLSALSKKSLHIHACPPVVFGQALDQSVAYLRSVLNFLGVKDQESVCLKGDDPEHGAKKEYAAARRSVLEIANCF